VQVPQDRQGSFRTEAFERYQRSEKALVAAMLEMYVQGVFTRKVKAITEELCGHEFSSSTLSRIVQNMDEELKRFARPTFGGAVSVPVLDARYEGFSRTARCAARRCWSRSASTGRAGGNILA
jgi:putative transposase